MCGFSSASGGADDGTITGRFLLALGRGGRGGPGLNSDDRRGVRRNRMTLPSTPLRVAPSCLAISLADSPSAHSRRNISHLSSVHGELAGGIAHPYGTASPSSIAR
jgi:hypothetical protein